MYTREQVKHMLKTQNITQTATDLTNYLRSGGSEPQVIVFLILEARAQGQREGINEAAAVLEALADNYN